MECILKVEFFLKQLTKLQRFLKSSFLFPHCRPALFSVYLMTSKITMGSDILGNAKWITYSFRIVAWFVETVRFVSDSPWQM